MTDNIVMASIARIAPLFWRIFAGVAVAFLLLQAGVAQQQSAELRIGVASLPQQLDPRRAADATTMRLMQLVAPGLAKLDDNFTPIPVIAESVAQLSPVKWRVQLAVGQVFHDGTPLTAALVKQFYESVQHMPSPAQSYLTELDTIYIVDELTLEFQLKRADVRFVQALALPLVNPQAVTQPVGLGEFKVERFTPRSELVLGNGVQLLSFQTVSDPLVRTLKLQRQELDVVHGDLPPELVQYLERRGYQTQSVPSESYTYLGLNCREGRPTSDVQVRRALHLALDRTALREALLGKSAQPAQSLLQPNHPMFESFPKDRYDIAQAKALLARAGYNDVAPLHLTVSSSTDPLALRMAQAIQQQWQQAGIAVKLQPQEWASYFAKVRQGDFDVNIMTWVGRFDTDIYELLFATNNVPPQGLNRGGCGDAKMDALLAQRKFQNVQQRQYEQVWDIPLWRRPYTLVMDKKLNKCSLLSDGGYEGLLQCRNGK